MSDNHRDFLPTILGTFAMVTAYAIASNEAIASIAPDHFYIFYPEWISFDEPWKHALCYGLLTGLVEGLAWGILLYWVGHYGPGPSVGPRFTLPAAAAVVILVGACAWGLGMHVKSTGTLVYPQNLYPVDDPALHVTLTVQITNYLFGTLGAAALVTGISLWRRIRSMKQSG